MGKKLKSIKFKFPDKSNTLYFFLIKNLKKLIIHYYYKNIRTYKFIYMRYFFFK